MKSPSPLNVNNTKKPEADDAVRTLAHGGVGPLSVPRAAPAGVLRVLSWRVRCMLTGHSWGTTLEGLECCLCCGKAPQTISEYRACFRGR